MKHWLLMVVAVCAGHGRSGWGQEAEVDRAEVLRLGNMVQHVGDIESDPVDLFVEAMGPPASDADKWFVSVFTTQGCAPCQKLKADWGTNPWLLALADPERSQEVLGALQRVRPRGPEPGVPVREHSGRGVSDDPGAAAAQRPVSAIRRRSCTRERTAATPRNWRDRSRPQSACMSRNWNRRRLHNHRCSRRPRGPAASIRRGSRRRRLCRTCRIFCRCSRMVGR